MNKQYFIYGVRPVYMEEKTKGIRRYYAFHWETGEFKEDMSYLRKITNDLSGDAIESTKAEFETYVLKLKKERGFV
jgi:hypothetical protein